MSNTTSVEGGEFPCGKCDRAFISQPALTMHTNRVHSKSVRVPGQKMSEEERLRKKRVYNRKYRLRKGMKVRPKSQKKDRSNHSVPWSKARRAKFNRTWAEKKNGTPSVRELLTIEDDTRDYINCCPNCGTNLQAYYLAARAARRHGQ